MDLISEADLATYRAGKFDCIVLGTGSKIPAVKAWQRSVGVPSLSAFSGRRNVGRIVPKGQVVLDLDMHFRNGKQQNGLGLLAELESQLGDLPDTHTVKTATGGRHLYYKTKFDFERKFELREDFEIKTRGNQTVLPPSFFAGDPSKGDQPGYYDWDISPQEVEIPFLPDNWEAYLLEHYSKKAAVVESISVDSSDADIYELEVLLSVLTSDLPRFKWFQVAGVIKNYYGAKDGFNVFDTWSQQGVSYLQNKPGDVRKQWDSATGKGLTIGTVKELVNKYANTKVIHMPLTEPPKPIVIECEGLHDRIVKEVNAKLPHQPMYGHLAAACIIGTLAQRRIRVAHGKGVPMQFMALATETTSQKSVIYQCIMSALQDVFHACVMRHPASAQALQAEFSTQASRFYGSDEAIAKLLAIYANPNGQNNTKSEMYTLMLEYFGDPKVVLGQRNKKDEDSSKSAVDPRLTWLAIGTREQFEKLVSTESFVSSGLASRFAPFHGVQSNESFDDFMDRKENGAYLSKELINDIKDRYGVCTFAADTSPSFLDIELPRASFELLRPFYNAMTKQELAHPETASIWLRMKQRAIWYAGVHAWANHRHEISEFDMRYGVSLSEYHVQRWNSILDNAHGDELTLCRDSIARVLLKFGPSRIGFIYKNVDFWLRKPNTKWLRKEAIEIMLESRELVQDGRTLFYSLTPEFIAHMKKAK